MKHFKKIMTSVLAASMLASMAVPAYAAEENEVPDPLPNTGDTQVTLEVKDTGGGDGGGGSEGGGDEGGGDSEIIAATVPVELPIVMDLKGNITVPSDAKIINHTEDSNIEVKDIEALMEADWAIADFNSDYSAKAENTKELGLAFRGDALGTNHKFALTDGNWVIGKNEGELQLKVEAKLPRQSKQAKTQIATVRFTLDRTDKQATDDTSQPVESVISHNWSKDKVLKDSVTPVTFTYDSTASGVSIASVESDNPAVAVEKSVQTQEQGNSKEEVWSVKAVSKGAATVTATLSTGETTSFNISVYELNIGDGGSITVPEIPNKGEGDQITTGDIVVDIPIATPDGESTIQVTPVIPPDTVLKPGANEIDATTEVDGITINIKIIINIQISNPSDGLHQSIADAQAMGFTFSSYEDGLQIDSFENKQFKSEINVPEQIGDFKVLKINNAFKGQSNLTKITLPNTAKDLGWNAFNGCTNAVVVAPSPDLYADGLDTFKGVKELHVSSLATEKDITGVVKAIKDGAQVYVNGTLFTDVDKVKNVQVGYAGSKQTKPSLCIGDDGSYLTNILEYDLFQFRYPTFSNVKDIVVPKYINGELVTSLQYGLIDSYYEKSECKLKKLYIPDSITTVGSDTLSFSGYMNQGSITVTINNAKGTLTTPNGGKPSYSGAKFVYLK